ncbi:MAG: aminotransferase class V-fold PLP-dependent enzyme [Gemmatimonadales bacterium]|nr:MAG: aminotransferase class V-fold PLP-dependent enzyme [Gemmatimonadales bacterium]
MAHSDHTHPDSLDPHDWDQFREACMQAVDMAAGHFQRTGQGPIWTEASDTSRATFSGALPSNPRPVEEVLTELETQLLPYTLGNSDPRFFGWVHGAGTPWGALAEFVSGTLNANMGGRNHAPHLVEQQVIRWFRDAFGLPDGTGGLLVSGTSMASVVGLACARHRATSGSVRRRGLPGTAPLVGYTSADAHISVKDAFSLLGLGSDHLQPVETREDGTLDPAALDRAIRRDLREGLSPFVVVANVGSVTCGAIDDMMAIRQVADRHGLWVHVDGAFGAAGILTPEIAPRLAGIQEADSLAMDFHKWFHVPYDAGLILVRDGELQKETFGGRADYLTSLPAGPGSGDTWPCDLGPELSRGFRALKVWFTLQALGSRRIGEAVARNCHQAQWLRERVDAHPQLQRIGPADLNIVNFRFNPAGGPTVGDLNDLNRQILLELHGRGLAIPSPLRRGKDLCIRVCLCNHRTRTEDLERLVENVVSLGREMVTQAA